MGQYPEHEKLEAVMEQSQAIGEFLDWVGEKYGGFLASYRGPDEYGDYEFANRLAKSNIDLIAEFYDVDPRRLEDEKRAMLEYLRKE